ncbi:MAG: hypothetical protein ACRDAL_02355 [Plesiomonas shigelloides]
MPNQIQVELDGKAINLTVSDDQMSIVSDDGREFKAVTTGLDTSTDCNNCAFRLIPDHDCDFIPCTDFERDDDGAYFIELT